MLELPIYNLVKQNKNKTLEIYQIISEYRKEKKIEFECTKCGDYSKIYTEIVLYTLPKYLMLYFIRRIDDKYIDKNIIYNDILEIKSDYYNKQYKYILECVVEHSLWGIYGTLYCLMSALCSKDKYNNIWYRFSDSFYYVNDNNFQSDKALILLYKSLQ